MILAPDKRAGKSLGVDMAPVQYDGGTRDKGVECGIDWLALTVHGPHAMPHLMDWMRDEWHDEWTIEEGRGWRGYQHRARSQKGALIAWSDGRSDFHVEMPGQLCAEVGMERLRWFLLMAFNHYPAIGCRVKCTRLDLRADDYDWNLSPDRVYEAMGRGDKRTRLKDVHAYQKLMNGQWILTGVTIGARGGETFVRCYDKNIESEGELNCCRFELELRDARAHAEALELSNLHLSEYCNRIQSVMRATVDFIDKSADSNISRCPLLDWWEAFCRGCEKGRASIIRPVLTLQGALNWMGKQWGSTIKMMFKAVGRIEFTDWLRNLAESAELNKAQRLLLEEMEFV